MITGMSGLFFTSEPEAARAVLKDILEFSHVEADDGWVTFDVPEASLAVHPIEDDHEPFHQLSFACDDLEETATTLEEAGLAVERPFEERGFGTRTTFELPGDVTVELFEPAEH